jgi:hypothetical protein
MSIWRLSGSSRNPFSPWPLAVRINTAASICASFTKWGWRRSISTGYPILKETLEELKIGAPEIEDVLQVIETTRETILNL